MKFLLFSGNSKLNPAIAVSKSRTYIVYTLHTALANPKRIVLFSIFIYVWIVEKCGYVSGAGL